MVYEFAIRKIIQDDGREVLIPVVRQKRKRWLFIKMPENEWHRIVCLYGKYKTLELNWNPDLTFIQCQDHIRGYQEKLIAEKSNVELYELQEKVI